MKFCISFSKLKLILFESIVNILRIPLVNLLFNVQIMKERKPTFKIGDQVKIANDLKTIYVIEKIHADEKYDLKPITEGAKLTGVAALQMSLV